MESDIVNGLISVGYSKIPPGSTTLEYLSNDEVDWSGFSQLIAFLSEKLKALCNLEEQVNSVSCGKEADMFCMELASLLRELDCPYSSLIEGSLKTSLLNKESRALLLNFLITEVQAAMINSSNNECKNSKTSLVENDTTKNLKELLINLGFCKPPPNITASQLFSKVEQKLKEIIGKVPKELICSPILTSNLTESQWIKLDEIYKNFVEDYQLRRELLLKRVDVTILSFTWSSQVTNKLNELSSKYTPLREQMHPKPNVKISHLLSARKDVAILEKTCNTSVRSKTQTPLNRIIIGQVPDRGGRANEQAPAPEMPRWQKRQPNPERGSGGYHRGGGGRVQGGWNQGGSSWGEDQKSHWRGRGRGGR